MSIADETPITLAEVAVRFKVSIRTVRRWTRQKNKPLKAWRVGSTPVTTKSAIEEFAEPVSSFEPVSSANYSAADIRRREEASARLQQLLGKT